MKPAHRRLCAPIACLALLLVPAASQGEAHVTASEPAASAALDFRIIVPPVMRVLENSHPLQLSSHDDGALSGQQRLVVLSNMRSGFCVALRLAQPGVGRWQLDARPEPGVTLHPTGDGYRICSARPGRYTLLLLHRFEPPDSSVSADLAWPVRTDITAI